MTRLRAADGSVWYVPNGNIRQLTNSSRGWAKAVVDVPVAPVDTAGLERVKEVVAASARTVASDPRFAASGTERPEVVGLVAARADLCTLRVTLRTTPGRRDALQRALREEVVAGLVAEGLWPGSPAEVPAPGADHDPEDPGGPRQPDE